MLKTLSIFLLFASALLLPTACTTGHTAPAGEHQLTAVSFAEKINELPDAAVIDVRSPEEFANGHLQKAKNINWNGSDFETQIATLNKNEPVFVYCLSGGRSAAAVAKMQSMGFKEVYELAGGIMKWRAAQLPEENQNMAGMTSAEFEQLLSTDKKVLVDFYANWCAPCKKMAPYLEELKNEMADSVIIVRINADTNQGLAEALKVDALPTVLLYKNKQQLWRNTGYIDKPEMIKNIQAY